MYLLGSYFTVAAENAVSVLPSPARYFKLEGLRLAVFASSLVKLKKTEKWTQKHFLFFFRKKKDVIFLFCSYSVFGTAGTESLVIMHSSGQIWETLSLIIN